MTRQTKTAAPVGDPKPPHRCPTCRSPYWFKIGSGPWLCWSCAAEPPMTARRFDPSLRMHAVP